jgi:hypothetical protein
MHGRAADVKWNAPWTETLFNQVKDAADNTSPIESFTWSTYPDHHYHAAW